jgi:hypothetical protein
MNYGVFSDILKLNYINLSKFSTYSFKTSFLTLFLNIYNLLII